MFFLLIALLAATITGVALPTTTDLMTPIDLNIDFSIDNATQSANAAGADVWHYNILIQEKCLPSSDVGTYVSMKDIWAENGVHYTYNKGQWLLLGEIKNIKKVIQIPGAGNYLEFDGLYEGRVKFSYGGCRWTETSDTRDQCGWCVGNNSERLQCTGGHQEKAHVLDCYFYNE
ncbi:hypothetical protein P280DRAFT_484830 [Massarina eburnea CBS 473.64]|uniref:Uncharacterized protein n=1 Tax=Massarina eburnea CBS 473.64 TaxID=1395130 RepID=A0A6A6RJP6_9PLEO|nr:hypothetical protein P280DRAFT_484830 [Massarina eburnea CBS 473.64]